MSHVLYSCHKQVHKDPTINQSDLIKYMNQYK